MSSEPPPPPPPPKRTREALQQLYSSTLEQEGYRPELDDDGDVRFRHEGSSFFIEVREDDPVFFRLVMPNFWDIESPAERLRVIEAANHACSEVKIAKVFIIRDSTWCAVELFLPSQEQFKSILQRCLLTIRNSVACFSEHMRNEAPKPPETDEGGDS